MTLQASGAISIGQIASEFGLAANAVFPTAFYGKGGAPGSGPLSLFDFYGRSNTSTLTASASPSTLNNDTVGSGATTNAPSTATPSGGTAPYSYLWSKVSGDAITINTATAAATTFSAVGLTAGESRSAIFRCTVTDSTGTPQTAMTNEVTVSIFNTN